MDPTTLPVQPMEPVQNLNQNIQSNIQHNSQNQVPPENNSKTNFSKLLFPILIFILLLIFLIPSIAIVILKPDFINNKSKKTASENLNAKIDGELVDNISDSKNLDKELEIIDLSTNKKVEFPEEVIAYCLTKEMGLEEESISIGFGDIDSSDELDENLWGFGSETSYIKDKKKFQLPTKVTSYSYGGSYIGPHFGVAIMNTNDEYEGYESEGKGSTGTIIIKEFEGCNPGSKFAFSINAVLASEESNNDKKLKAEGTFHTVLRDWEEIAEELESNNKIATEETEESTAEKNNRKRQSAVTQILNSVGAYYSDTNGKLPTSISTIKSEISSKGADLCDDIVGAYMPALPVDPSLNLPDITNCSSSYSTGYTIQIDSQGRVTVAAPSAEDGQVIQVTR